MSYRYAPFIGFSWFHLLLFAGLAILVIVLLVALVRRSDTRPSGQPPHWSGPPAGPGSIAPPAGPGSIAPPVDPALQILRERFARGEISEAEFLSIRATLTGPPQ